VEVPAFANAHDVMGQETPWCFLGVFVTSQKSALKEGARFRFPSQERVRVWERIK
jgi:hypothetical protein